MILLNCPLGTAPFDQYGLALAMILTLSLSMQVLFRTALKSVPLDFIDVPINAIWNMITVYKQISDVCTTYLDGESATSIPMRAR